MLNCLVLINDNMYLDGLYTQDIHDGHGQRSIPRNNKSHSKSVKVNNKMWIVLMIAVISGMCICGGMAFLLSIFIGGGCCAYYKLNRKETRNICVESNVNHV